MRKQSPEHIAKRVKAHKKWLETNPPNRKGVRLSPEHKMKIGEANRKSNLKKGFYITKKGYVKVYLPAHPSCDKDNYVLEHRVVMENALNRLLSPVEVVHHINGNKKDNVPRNLKLFANGGKHTSYHHKNKH